MRRLKSPLLIVSVALVLRLGLLAYGKTYQISPASGYWNFGGEMGRIGRSIAQGNGFSSPYWAPTGPTAQQPPVYPYLLAGAFKVFGVYTTRAAFAILSLNSLFSALTCALILLIGREAFGDTVGALAAWVWVLWPSAALTPITDVGHESIDAFLLAALLYMTLRLKESQRTSAWALFGVLCGIAVLANPVVLSALPFLWGWLYYKRRQRRIPGLPQFATATLLVLIVILPWVVRNYEVFHHPVFIRDDFGMELHLGNHAGASGAHTMGLVPGENAGEWEQYQRMGESAYMLAKRRQVFSFIKSHPGDYAWLCLQRFGELWIWTGDFRPFGSALRPLIWQAFYLVLPVMAVIGLALALRNRLAAAWLLAYSLCPFLAAYVVIEYASPRYRHPIEPEMIVLGTYAVTVASRWMRGRIWLRPPAQRLDTA